MAEILLDHKKVVIKIVYYGPALSGKTTNLMQLHGFLNPAQCGELMAFETRGDRTLFFDLLPLMIPMADGFRLKIKLFTVPGQVAHDATRKAVLSRADGVVFVADSRRSQAVINFESFENLEKNTFRVGLDFDDLPLVVQFNKRDLADIISENEIETTWNPTGIPVTFASALHGKGVVDTFQAILQSVHGRLGKMNGFEMLQEVPAKDLLRTFQP